VVVSQVVELVKKERRYQPRVGTRKLHKELCSAFENENLKIGRDRLFDILRQYNMLVKRKKATCRNLSETVTKERDQKNVSLYRNFFVDLQHGFKSI
jgi:phage antirepressor YoqD-like protein